MLGTPALQIHLQQAILLLDSSLLQSCSQWEHLSFLEAFLTFLSAIPKTCDNFKELERLPWSQEEKSKHPQEQPLRKRRDVRLELPQPGLSAKMILNLLLGCITYTKFSTSCIPRDSRISVYGRIGSSHMGLKNTSKIEVQTASLNGLVNQDS